MSNQQIALRLALEALNTTESDCGSLAWERGQEAIAALREALTEQTARQCKWPTCQREEYQQALAGQIKRELVGEQSAQQDPFGYFKAEPFGWTDCAETDEGAVALYERPPAQRKPLSVEKMFEAIRPLYNSDKAARLAVNHSKDEYRAIEAARGIKEKNNG